MIVKSIFIVLKSFRQSRYYYRDCHHCIVYLLVYSYEAHDFEKKFQLISFTTIMLVVCIKVSVTSVPAEEQLFYSLNTTSLKKTFTAYQVVINVGILIVNSSFVV